MALPSIDALSPDELSAIFDHLWPRNLPRAALASKALRDVAQPRLLALRRLTEPPVKLPSGKIMKITTRFGRRPLRIRRT